MEIERNWLIRTAQNQILGPVAKPKLLEFIQKGALGLLDEVSSGNGYWFSLKERDLVEKYLYGDIPQGYNPISESKSVLARRENPEKTSSINTAPVNESHTQVIKLSDLNVGVIPKSEDLEFPDIATPSTAAKTAAISSADEVKLPASDDLEFPDLSLVSSNANHEFEFSKPAGVQAHSTAAPVAAPKPVAVAVQKVDTFSSEEIVLPNEDDLAFPDMNEFEKTSTKVEKGKVDLSHQYTRTVALDSQQSSSVLPVLEENEAAEEELVLSVSLPSELEGVEEQMPEPEPEPVVAPVVEKKLKLDRSPKKTEAPVVEEKKLLHDRKVKSSKASAQRDPTRETVVRESESEPLKKRNDNYIFFILIILILIIVAVFFYFKEILNKPLPV